MPPIELVLHRGNSYGRSLRAISPDSPEIGSLKRRLRKIAERYDDDNDEAVDVDSDIIEIDIAERSSNEIVCISEDSSIEASETTSNKKVKTSHEDKSGTDDENGNKGHSVMAHNSQEPSTSGINSNKKAWKVISLGSSGVKLISEEVRDDCANQGRDITEEEQFHASVPRCMLKTASSK